MKSEGFDWDAVFPGEPTSLDKLQAKHGAENLTEMPGIQNTTFLVGARTYPLPLSQGGDNPKAVGGPSDHARCRGVAHWGQGSQVQRQQSEQRHPVLVD